MTHAFSPAFSSSLSISEQDEEGDKSISEEIYYIILIEKKDFQLDESRGMKKI